jgi:hypothetical protein
MWPSLTGLPALPARLSSTTLPIWQCTVESVFFWRGRAVWRLTHSPRCPLDATALLPLATYPQNAPGARRGRCAWPASGLTPSNALTWSGLPALTSGGVLTRACSASRHHQCVGLIVRAESQRGCPYNNSRRPTEGPEGVHRFVSTGFHRPVTGREVPRDPPNRPKVLFVLRSSMFLKQSPCLGSSDLGGRLTKVLPGLWPSACRSASQGCLHARSTLTFASLDSVWARLVRAPAALLVGPPRFSLWRAHAGPLLSPACGPHTTGGSRRNPFHARGPVVPLGWK